MNIWLILIQFLITFIIIYLIYYFFVIRKCKKTLKYAPVEVNLILTRYNIDVKKINLYGMIKVVSFVTSLILSVTITLITAFFDSTIISIIFGTLISVLVAIIVYNIIGRIYEKKSKKVVKKK